MKKKIHALIHNKDISNECAKTDTFNYKLMKFKYLNIIKRNTDLKKNIYK